MDLQVTQENLNRALTSVSRVASSRGGLPILSNIAIKTVNNRLMLAATDLNIAVTHYIGSKISKNGGITVPARLTQEFISSLPSSTIDLKLDNTKLNIKTSHYQSTINGTTLEDYPVMPTIENGTKWKVPAQTLKNSLSQTIIAASTDETRQVLASIYIFSHDKKLVVAATDSYRLAERVTTGINKDIKLLIPIAAGTELIRLIGDFSEDVEVHHNDQQAMFKFGDIELTTRLVEGGFPDYKKLIPNKFARSGTLDRAELTNIVKVASLFARESAGSVTINLDKDKKEISIRSIASQLGENASTAEAQVSQSGQITLNSRYIIDALNVINGGKVTLSFNEKLEPCVLKSEDDPDYTHVIMPLKS